MAELTQVEYPATKDGPPSPQEHEENLRSLIVYHMSEIERLTEELDNHTGSICSQPRTTKQAQGG